MKIVVSKGVLGREEKLRKIRLTERKLFAQQTKFCLLLHNHVVWPNLSAFLCNAIKTSRLVSKVSTPL